MQSPSKINDMLNYGNSMGNGARRVRLGSYEGTWCTECNGTKLVTISQILMKLGPFFVRQDNILQTFMPSAC